MVIASAHSNWAAVVVEDASLAVPALEMFGLDEGLGSKANVKRRAIGEFDVHLGAIIALFVEREGSITFPASSLHLIMDDSNGGNFSGPPVRFDEFE